MIDDVAKILALARDFPGLGIDAERARQIAAECACLRQAGDTAARRFAPAEPAAFDAMYDQAHGNYPAQ